MLKKFVLSIAATAVAMVGTVVHAYETRSFNIPPGDLAPALESLAKETGLELIFQPDELKGIRTQGVTGTLSPQEAVARLINGTRLTIKTDSAGAILISAAKASIKTADAAQFADLRLAQSQSENPENPEEKSGNRPSTPDSSSGNSELSSESSETEVVVTGSRLTRKSADGAQDVRVYGAEEIQRSGQTTLVGFLSTLPSASVTLGENNMQDNARASTTVRLRGLPSGTTLTLINGQRLETSGGQVVAANFFDLGNIPISAIERVEVLAGGASALYGSDAIAGVVNIILKDDMDGLSFNVRYGRSHGTDESNASIAWGGQWNRGSLTVIGNYQDRSELQGSERELTASNDYRRFGGPDRNFPFCNPGNVSFPGGYSFNGGAPVSFAAIPPGLTGTPNVQDFAATAGTRNTCPLVSSATYLIPPAERVGVMVAGKYALTPSVTAFSDLLYSRTQLRTRRAQSTLRAALPAANPYNPFGTAVTVDYAFPSANINEVDTDFARAVLGLKGKFGGAWTWELSALHSQDWVDEFDPKYFPNTAAIQTALNSTDPATAFNPFTAGLPVTPQVLATFFSDSGIELESRRQAVNGLLRGSLLELPAGAVEWALGGEYAREKQTAPLSLLPIGDRNTAALFAETRVPLLSSRAQERDILALSLAARYDDYSDFGDTTNPQFAAEWRPFDTLLVRGTYAEAFKAPSLDALHRPERTTPANTVRDPVTGQTVVVASRTGGNPALRPEKGESQTFGIVYSSKAMPGFRLSVTHWEVRQTDAIQSLTAQAIIDNEASFPGRVIRNSAGVIQVVDGRLLNFGGIETAGLDYELNYQRQTSLGLWSGSVAATQFDTYDIRLTPGAPPLGQISLANSTNNWAPRWKGATTLGWQRNDHSVNFVGRYVSRYQDYSSTRQIGDFWVFDVHARSEFGKLLGLENSLLRRAYIEVGGVNLFDKLPQYSNYSGSLLGYDPSQGDIRGRHLFLQIGTQL